MCFPPTQRAERVPRGCGPGGLARAGPPRAGAQYLLPPPQSGARPPSAPRRSRRDGPLHQDLPLGEPGPGRLRVKRMAKRPPEEERREEAAAAPTGHLSAALQPHCARGVFRRSLRVAPAKADPRNARCNRRSHLGFCVVVRDPWVKHCQPGVCGEFPSPTLPVHTLKTGSQVSFSGKSAHPAPSRGRRCLHFHAAPPHPRPDPARGSPHSPTTDPPPSNPVSRSSLRPSPPLSLTNRTHFVQGSKVVLARRTTAEDTVSLQTQKGPT